MDLQRDEENKGPGGAEGISNCSGVIPASAASPANVYVMVSSGKHLVHGPEWLAWPLSSHPGHSAGACFLHWSLGVLLHVVQIGGPGVVGGA